MKIHYTKIGDIALLKIPSDHDESELAIAHEILKKEHSINVVIRVFQRYGEFRKRQCKVLIGNRTDTFYTEFGLRFHVDVKESYFSEREKTERQRLQKFIVDHERILVLFAGVGVIPIIVAHQKDVTVTAVEKNPQAFSLMKENISKNRLRGSIEPLLQDSYTFINTVYERVIVPQPYRHHSFSIAAPLVKEQGYMHYYTWKPVIDPPQSFPGFSVCSMQPLFSYAPGIHKICYDLQKDVY
jgi:tRNA (guanine37-N1)-methyltransferase